MVIGLAPFVFVNNDLSANLTQIRRGLELARGKADLLCFGEAFLQGFDAMNWDYAHDWAAAVPQDSCEIRQLCELTLQYGVDLLFGYLEREDDRLYSSCMVIEKGKILHNYRRISKGWKEYWHTDDRYLEGDTTEDFFYRGQQFRIALCGDLWDFPERFRTQGTLLWPVCCNYDREEWENKVAAEYAAQAATAAAKTLYVDAVDADHSCPKVACFFEKGSITAQISTDEEAVLYVEL